MAGSPNRLSPAEITDRLRAQFGQDVVDAQDVHGHAVFGVTPARYAEIARFLRDEPDLAVGVEAFARYKLEDRPAIGGSGASFPSMID